MSEQEIKDDTAQREVSSTDTGTNAPETEAPVEATPEPPKAPEPESCDVIAKGGFLNGKGVMTADGKCMDLERLQVLLVEQNGKTYEYSRVSVR